MSVLDSLVGWLAPPDCLNCGAEGLSICETCSASVIRPFGERCWRCNKLSPASRTCAGCRHVSGPGSVWISTDYEGAAMRLVRTYKFGHLRAAVHPIARQMIKTFHDLAKESDYLVVPVPTATSRIRERGFGHSELLAKIIAARLHLEYAGVLRRLDQTRQLGSRREDRLKQLENSFAVKSHRAIKDRQILLVDDVLTTGGTIIAATKTLKSAGAKQVDALLFAKRL